jgi:hypothetical protein
MGETERPLLANSGHLPAALESVMSRESLPLPARIPLPLTNPWPVLGTALAAAVLGMLVQGHAPVAVRIFLIVTGLLLALGAVAIRLRTIQEDAEDRFRAAGIVALAAAVPFLALLSVGKDEWDSFQLLLRVLVGIGLATAGLLLMPRTARRLTLVVLVLFHFGGILSAVGSPAPAGGQQSWLINQLWVRVYRPYLYFCYLNNAYHFYSPDPGPPMLLWFRIEYEGGKVRWVELPQDEARSGLAFQRRLALTESVNQPKTQQLFDFNDRLLDRIEAGQRYKHGRVPLMDDGNRALEYREPIAYAKQLLKSYARYVMLHFPCEEDPALKPVSVKIYRVIHMIPSQDQVAHYPQEFDPFHPTTYLPYFQGEFDSEGRLKNAPKYKDGVLVDRGDPFLYWLIPIKRELKDDYRPRIDPDGRALAPQLSDFKAVDYLKVHAGDKESMWDLRAKAAANKSKQRLSSNSE